MQKKEKSKKAVSQIVTTILIILLVLAAIVIVWNAVKETITEKSGEAEIEVLTVNSEIQKSSVYIDESQGVEKLQLSISRGADNVEISSMKVVIQGETDSAIYELKEDSTTPPPKALETKTYSYSIVGLGEIKKVSVYPVSKKGKIGIAGEYNIPESTNRNALPPNGWAPSVGCTNNDRADCSKQSGVCAGSQEICTNEQWPGCDYTSIQGYQAEEGVCDGDGLDNDCDGTENEGCECTSSEQKPCDNQVGVCAGSMVTCSNNQWPECNYASIPSYEITEISCDAKDNDCDGSTDETFPTLGQSCSVGVGECARTGTYVCSADKLSTVCDATPGTPGTEIYNNGVDENCDGGDNLIACGTLSVADATYFLDNDIALSSGGTCFNIIAGNIVLDLKGHSITGYQRWYNLPGVYINGYNNIIIKDGGVSWFDTGVYIQNSQGSKITNIQLINNANGLYIQEGSSNTIQENTVSSNTQYGIRLTSSSNNNLIRNTANSNTQYGIYISGGSGNTIQGNTANLNQYGLLLSSANTNTINDNWICMSSAYDFFCGSSTGTLGTGNKFRTANIIKFTCDSWPVLDQDYTTCPLP